MKQPRQRRLAQPHFERIEFEIRVRACPKGEDATLRGIHPRIPFPGVATRLIISSALCEESEAVIKLPFRLARMDIAE